MAATSIPGADGERGALAVAFAVLGEPDLNACLADLHAAAAMVDLVTSDVGPAMRPADGDGSSAAIRRFGSHRGLGLAVHVTNDLRASLGVEQVVLASIQRHRPHIVGVSGQSDVRPRSPGLRLIVEAMAETLDRGLPIVVQGGDAWDEGVPADGHRLHRRWSQATGSAVASFPLTDGPDVVGVVAIRARNGQPLDNAALKSASTALDGLGPLTRTASLADRSLAGHAADTVRAGVRRSVRSPLRVVVPLFLVTICAWLAGSDVAFRPTVAAAVAPAQVWHVVMPVDGTLDSMAVREGDSVRAGDQIATIDGRAFALEIDRLNAAIATEAIQERDALSAGDSVTAMIAGARRDGLDAERSAVQQQLEATRVVASADGLVVEGDRRTLVGQRLGIGSPIVAIADGRWSLDLEVPESLVRWVEPSTPGTFAPHARPDTRLTLSIDRILPQAEMRGDQRVFIAVATVHDAPDWFRGGMAGTVRLDAGDRPAWWAYGHSVVEAVQRRMWR
ncbi:MAG: efflux RND transporter periplasmic adaptor subunit [Phycisphaerales bacterium]